MNTPITLKIDNEDLNRVTFPEGITWETPIIQRKNNTRFTYVNRAGEALKYTIPKVIRHSSCTINSPQRCERSQKQLSS